MGRLSKGAFFTLRIVLCKSVDMSSKELLSESMLVLGVTESEDVEKVVEMRELELEERWKMPMFTMLIQFLLYGYSRWQ
jgi:hypothetical protein